MSVFDSQGKYQAFQDYKGEWEAVKRNVVTGFSKRFPVTIKDVTLEVVNVQVLDKEFTKSEQKQYILSRRDLTVPVNGDVILKDAVTGKVLDKKTNIKLMALPKYTERFTFIIGGNEYSVSNQHRLRAGVYTRHNAVGDVESQFNTGAGRGFTIDMDPATGVFKLTIQNSHVSLYSFLKKMGYPVQGLLRAWGKELYDVNSAREDVSALRTVWESFFGRFRQWSDEQQAIKDIEEYFVKKGTLEEGVTQTTLGKPYKTVTLQAIVDASVKILKVNRREVEEDDRDDLQYKKILSVSDFIQERIERDADGLAKKLVYKINTTKTLEKLPSSPFTSYARNFIIGSALTTPATQTNILEVLEAPTAVTVMGEGGIQSTTAIPDETRNIHPSHAGVLDPVRTPESIKVGVSGHFTVRTFKGPDNTLAVEVRDVKTNRKKIVPITELAKSVVAMPGEMAKNSPMVSVIDEKNRQSLVSKKKVKYELLDGGSLLGMNASLVPMLNTSSPNRLQMASKMVVQALPLENPDVQLVQAASSTSPGVSFARELGGYISPVAEVDGTVTAVSKDSISLKTKAGREIKVDLYNNFPFNQKTMVTNYPKVSVGQKVKKGDILADSNYTKDGTIALGRNLNVAYLNYKGLTFEDGVVISEAAAQKLTSEHVYQEEISIPDNIEVNRQKYVSMFPMKLSSETLSKLDSKGVVKTGAKVSKGEIMVTALMKKVPNASDLALGKLSKGLLNMYQDVSLTWEHDHPGEVLEVYSGPKHIKVVVKTHEPVKPGDKLSGAWGNKGVVSRIIPTAEMPVRKDGTIIEMFMSPEGLVSRMNPGQIHETILGKVADKTGKTYVLPSFGQKDVYKFVRDEAKKAGVSDRDELTDPVSGQSMGEILNGKQHIFKLFKTSDVGASGRSGEGMYTINKQPAKGGFSGSKVASTWDMWAMLGHNVKDLMRETTTYKGERSDMFWRAVKEGRPIPKPQVPFVFDKFEAMYRQAGGDLRKDGDYISASPLTDEAIMQLSSGEISNSRMVKLKDMSPEDGGLFDLKTLGGVSGKRYGHIDLHGSLPNPLMEEPIRVLLSLTKQGFQDVLAGRRDLNGGKGMAAIKAELAKINVAAEAASLEKSLSTLRGGPRDKAIKKLRYLTALKRMGKKPEDYLLSKVSVIPPEFRPMIVLPNGERRITGANYLYRDVIQARDALDSLGGDLGEEDTGALRLGMYNAVKALQGMGDPVSPDALSRNVKGAIREISGSSPKHGFFQSSMLRKPQDLTGRGVAIPMPSLKMDQLGLPEKIAFQVYKPFTIQKLLSMKVLYEDAEKAIEAKDPRARNALEAVMRERPVIVNRAPMLHKFNLMAFWPVLVQGASIGFPSVVVSGFNLDYDGDQVNVYVPVTPAAVEDAKRMMPSKNLHSLGRHQDILHKPAQGAVMGLYDATTKGKESPTVFQTPMAAHKAFERGEISYNTPVKIDSLTKTAEFDNCGYEQIIT